MKLVLASSLFLLLGSAFAETYKLPNGTTFRAKGIGFDCGEFFKGTVPAPKEFAERGINLYQMAADKDLNTFLIEAHYPASNGDQCIYGAFFNRSRATKTVELDYALITKTNEASDCSETEAWLSEKFNSMKYHASKRGIRYVAFDVIEGANDVCESEQVRAVFDRRAE